MKAKLSLALCLTLASMHIYALSVGKTAVHSYLDEPLDATVSVSVSDAERDTLQISVADAKAYKDNHLTFSPILKDIQIKTNKNGTLSLISTMPITDPSLDVLLLMRTPKEKLSKNITLLFDPKPVAIAKAKQYGPITDQDELWDIARRMQPESNLSIDQVMVGIFNANPDAFVANNMNQMKVGATLIIPDVSTLAAVNPLEAKKMVAAYEPSKGNSARTSKALVQSEQNTIKNKARLPFNIVSPTTETKLTSDTTAANAPQLKAELVVTADALNQAQQKITTLQKQIDGLNQKNAVLAESIVAKDQMLLDLQKQLGPNTKVKTATPLPSSPAPVIKKAMSEAENGRIWPWLVLGVIIASGGAFWLLQRYKNNGQMINFSDFKAALKPRMLQNAPRAKTHETENNAFDHVAEAKRLIQNEKFEAAERMLTECLRQSPLRSDAALCLLKLYVTLQQPQKFLALETSLAHGVLADANFIAALNELRDHFNHSSTPTTTPQPVAVSTPAASIDSIMQQVSSQPVLVQKAETANASPVILKALEPEVEAEPEIIRVLDFNLSEDDKSALQANAAVEKAIHHEGEHVVEFKNPVMVEPVADTGARNMQEQLDIAQAYVEIEDFEGAEALLAQVVQQGLPEQKALAEQLLQKVHNH